VSAIHQGGDVAESAMLLLIRQGRLDTKVHMPGLQNLQMAMMLCTSSNCFVCLFVWQRHSSA
jgi:hypothetical protein